MCTGTTPGGATVGVRVSSGWGGGGACPSLACKNNHKKIVAKRLYLKLLAPPLSMMFLYPLLGVDGHMYNTSSDFLLKIKSFFLPRFNKGFAACHIA